MSSLEKNYSLFCGAEDQDKNFWAWRSMRNNAAFPILSEENGTRNSNPSTTSSSNSPDQNWIRSEFDSLLEELQPNQRSSTLNANWVNWEQDLNSLNVVQPPKTMPIMSMIGPASKVVGPKLLKQVIQDGQSFVLMTGSHHLQANKEAYFYIVPKNLSLDVTPQAMRASTTVAFAKIIHSSGFPFSVEIQKLHILPGFRCSFFPIYAGKYSAKVFKLNMDNVDLNAHISESLLLCPPLELEVSRNYFEESRCPLMPPINLDENGQKYWGITADKFTNRLYVADRYNNDVLVLDPTTIANPIYRFGQDPYLRVSGNELCRPSGLVMDNINKRLIICDKDNHRICMFTIDGHFISSFGRNGHGAGEFDYPWDVDISPNGDIMVVSDSRNHRIQFFDRYGNYLKRFSIFETAPFEYKRTFDYPRGVTFSQDGKSVLVTDFNNNSIVRLVVDTLEYKLMQPISGKLNRPQGITTDASGNLLVCDSRRNLFRVLNSDCDVVCSLNKIGRNQITFPVDCCCFQGGLVATLCLDGSIHLW